MKRNRYFIAMLMLLLAAVGIIKGQNPSTGTAPISALNAKYTNGIAPGYYPTKGTGLTLNLSPGSVFCNGTMRTYAGGTLTMTDAAANYVFLDPSANCAPTKSTTVWTDKMIPIAVVVTASGNISTITDDRTPFVNPILWNVTANTPLTSIPSGNTFNIQCDNCSGAPLGTAVGTIAGAFVVGLTGNGGTNAANLEMFHGGNAFPTCGAGSFWPISGSFRNVTISSAQTQGKGMIMRGAVSPDCSGVFNTGTGPLADNWAAITPGAAAGTFVAANPNAYAHVSQLGQVQLITSRALTGGTSARYNGLSVEFVADSGTWSVWGNFLQNTIGASTTSFNSFFNSGGFTTENSVTLPIPIAGTFQYMTTNMTSGNGAAALNVTLRKNGADSSLVNTVDSGGAAGPWYDFTHTVSVSAGDYIALKYAMGAATSGTIGGTFIGFTPATGTTAIIGGNIAGNSISTAAQFCGPFSSPRNATEADSRVGMPRAGTASKLYVYLANAVTSGHTVTVALEKNGADSALTCTITNAAGTGVFACDTTHTVSYAKGDNFSFSYKTSAGSDNSLAGWAFAYD